MSDTVMLVKVDGYENNNKFYELTRRPDGRVQARWGRIGYEGQTRTYDGGMFHEKLSEKLRKGYVRFGDSDTPQSTKVHATRGSEHRVLKSLFGDVTSAIAEKLIRSLLADNRHTITGVTDGAIKVSSSGTVTTALGPVTLSQITEARSLLSDISRERTSNGGTVSIRTKERYLILIPQPVKRVGDNDWITTRWITSQRDLLDALETAVTVVSDDGSDEDEGDSVPFRHGISAVVSGSAEFIEVEKRFVYSQNINHSSAGRKLLRVWKLVDQNESEWETRKRDLKHTRTLWHGTTAGNVLSILRTGLICPPSSDSRYATTGRMFGDGCYFSNQSTKALNYACGTWSRDIGSGNPMMFLADVVMGREFRPTSSTMSVSRQARTEHDDKGRPYNSIFVRAGSCGIRNNEMIVWDSPQIKLTYLCEFSG
jgi:poly [ADP-ribose] polymerase